MTTAPDAGIELVAIDLTGADAARAVRRCWDADEAVVVINAALPDAAKSALLWQIRPTSVIDSRGRRSLRGVPAEPGTAAVVMTSGTGADPKAVTLTRPGMQAMAIAYSGALGVTERDRWLVALPLTSVAGLAIIARSYVTGVGVEIQNGFDTNAVARAAIHEAASVASLVPTALARLLDAGAPIDRFRTIVIGGAPLPDRLRARAEAAGAHLVTSYGLTETWGGFSLDGRPMDAAEVRIAGDGEIEVSGPMVMRGYRLDREATADVLRDGWLSTGDLGSWDEDGLAVTGRKDDRILTGGVTVSPAAVERILLTDPAIVDAAVVGAPDEEWGERVVAYIVPANPADVPNLDDIRALVKLHLPVANAPRQVHPVSRIPRNPAGKVMRRKLQ
jgi:O-succinylbenzoic acid--CoA ligase